MPSRIRAVLLDVGGVLVELDGMPSLAALLGSAQCHQALHQRWMASKAVIAHETGTVSADEFAERLVAELCLPVPSTAFLAAFKAWPRRLRPGTLELLEAIRSNCVVAALSNTSAVHWERIADFGLAHQFHRTYLSFETGHLKPAQDAFQVALADLGIHPSEALFFDDSDTNVRGAQALGIHAHLAQGPLDVERTMQDYGLM